MTPDDLAPLIEAAAEGRLTAAERDRLEVYLRSDPAAVADYVAQLRLHALLGWRHGRVAAPPAEPRPAVRSRRRWVAAGAALAAAVLVVVGAVVFRSQPTGSPTVAVVVRSDGDGVPTAGTRLAPGRLPVEAGDVELRFDSGTVVAISGPAVCEVVDALTLRVDRGRLTARLEAGGQTGFTIRTPAAAVIDLSTEFGVAVDDAGSTDVVVFEGAVEVRPTAAEAPPATRLARGDAVRVGPAGRSSRIVSVSRGPGAGWSAGGRRPAAGVIAAVSDNLADPDGMKAYQVVRGGLTAGTLAYVDRDYRWAGADGGDLPAGLRGADLVMTFNDDKRQPDLELTVSLATPARVFVFTDDRSPPPGWLAAAGFADTGLTVGLRETTPGGPVRPFSVWVKRVPTPGDVRLGPNAAKGMYAVAAVPDTVRVACLGDSITAGAGYVHTLQEWLGSGYEVRNFGASGATLLAKGDRPYVKEKAYADAVAWTPDVVTVMLGTNDTKPQNFKFIDDSEANLKGLVTPLLGQSPVPRVFVALPPPVYFDGSFGIDGNRLQTGVLPRVRAAAAELKLPVVDVHAALSGRPDLFFRDNVHPLGGGAELAAPFYEAITGKKPPVPVSPAPPRQVRVACLGDSITEGSGYPAAVQQLLGNRYMVRNFGVSGATLLAKGDKPYTRQARFAAAKAFEPDAVLVVLGTNDTKPQNFKHIAAFADELAALCDEVSGWPGKPKVFLGLPVPVTGGGNFGIDNGRLEEGVLPAIRAVAEEKRLPLVDLNAPLRGKPELFKNNVPPVGAQHLLARPVAVAVLAAFPPPPVTDNLLTNPGAEDGAAGWVTRGGKLAAVADPVRAGRSALKVTGRTAGWHGPGQDAAAGLRAKGGGYYHLRGSVRLGPGAKPAEAVLVLMVADVRGTRYLKTPARPVSADGWTDFADDVFVGWSGELKSALFYVETNGAADADLLADEFAAFKHPDPKSIDRPDVGPPPAPPPAP